MNRIYKVIWSKVKHCYVVVSEIARNHGKEHSCRKRTARGVCGTLLALVLGLSVPFTALAADPVDLGNGGKASYDSQGNLTVGNQVYGTGDKNAGRNNTAIGTNSDTLRNGKDGETTKNGQPLDTDSNTKLVDGESKAHSLDLSTESGGSTAVGYNNRSEGDRSTAIGNSAKITNKPITYYADADGNKTTSADAAAWYKDADGKPTLVPQVFRDADGNMTATPQYVHTYTEKDAATGEEVTRTEITSDASLADQKDGKPVYNYEKDDNTDHLYSVTLYQAADNSIAAGTDVTANGSNAVAVGYNSTADNSAVAMGDTASAAENAVAIGKNATASAEGAIALGKNSQGDRAGGVTGWDPKTGTTSTSSSLEWQSTDGALSVGSGTASRQITGVAAGSEDSDAVNLAQLKKAMTHYYSVKTTETTDQAGHNNYLNDGATGDNALAAGVSAVASGDSATAVGNQTVASGTNASAYGYRSVASGSDSVAIGSGTSAQKAGAIAIGGHAMGENAVQVGTGSTAQSANAVAIGGHAKGENSVEVGSGATAQGAYSTSVGGHAIGANSIAIGSEYAWGRSNPASAAGQNSIAIGGHTNGDNNIAIGAGSATSSYQAITVGGSASGSQAVSVGNSANATAGQATAIGYGSAATGQLSTAVGGHASRTKTTAVGQDANATYDYATAVGTGAEAGGQYSTALGYGTSSNGTYTTAIGGASASGSNVTAIGKSSTAGGYGYISDATAIGGAHVSSSYATAIGSNATVNGQYGVALGQNSNVSDSSTGVGANSKATNTGTAVGYGAQAYGSQSAAVGGGSMATGTRAVSLGGGGAWGDYSIALGSGAGTNADGIAIGLSSGAWGTDAIAIGTGSNAWRANSIVLGKNSKSGADKNIEGYDPRTGAASVDASAAWYSTDEAVSIGRAEEKNADGNVTATAITRQLSNVAAGTLDTDAVNVAQLKAAAQKINMHDYSVYSPDTETDTNYTNGGAVAKNSMAAGVSASTSENAENAVAIGYKARADGFGATVIGQYGTATGRYALAFGGQQTDVTAETANNLASGDNAVAFGERTVASGNNATAFGQRTVASGVSATAFGSDSTASGEDSLAFGENSTAAAKNSLAALGGNVAENAANAAAIGKDAKATLADSVALGSKSVASRAKYSDLTSEAEKAAYGKGSSSGSAWEATDNAIAVGNDSTVTRQITGVAAGSLDTDAVNVAQLKAVSDAVNNAAETAGRHTVVTVNDKDSATAATAGTGEYGEYAGTSDGNLLIAAKNDNGQMTYNIKLNDQLAIGQKGTDGQDGKDGKVTVETKDGTSVVIGHDGKDGDDGKDGLFVRGEDGADGKSGVSITGPNGQDGSDGKVGIAGKDGKDAVSLSGKDGAGHIGLTGPKGENGRDGASIDIQTDYGDKTLDDSKNITVDGEEKASRLIYTDDKGSHQVATMDDGLKFVGNDGKEVARKLNTTLSVTGGLDKDAVQAASAKNLGVRSNTAGDGLEIVMTDTPDFAKVTIGTGTGSSGKIILGEQTVTGKKADGTPSDTAQTGNYITGLDNKAWDKDNIVEDRAATEGQLRDVAASITDEAKGGGFGLADEKGSTVKKDLGQTVTVKGDGKNIETKVDGDALEVSLKKDVDLGKDGSIKAGDTTIDKDGVDTNKITIKDSSISIDKDGINAGNTQITNMASGASAITTDENGNKKYEYNVDSNGANIGDVKRIASDEAGKAAEAVKARSGKNITVKDDHTVNLNDHITLGDDTDTAKQVDIDGKGAKVTAGSGENQVTVDGSKGQVTIGSGDSAVTLGRQVNTAGDSNPAEGRYLNGLDNKSWDGTHIQSGRAATEDQLKTVSDKVNSGRVFQGDDGKSVTVGMGETLKFQGGASEVSDANNIGIVKGADDTLNVRLAKDLTGLSSVTTGNTTINNSGLTVKGGNSHQDITIQQGNVSMGGSQIHNVAPGTAPTDAVNVSQLQQTGRAINQLGSSLDKLGTRVDRVGANSAALAALHPLDFDPDDKLDFAVGAGNYSGANAVALGAFYRPNEDVMFSLGGSTGGGENMINVGATFKIGQHNHVSNSRVAMAKEIRDLKALVARQDSEMQQMKNMMNQLAGKTVMTVDRNVLFPDIPENHWAYEYVTKLAKAGIVEGYEDGEFKGNRMMSRYEFAALVYRAIMAGAASNPELNKDGTLGKLAKEFSGELQYITIAVVDKDKNGKPTIERVRTVEDDARHHSK